MRHAWRKPKLRHPFRRPWIGMIILKCEDVNGFMWLWVGQVARFCEYFGEK